MKVILELRNINSVTADVYTEEGQLICTSYSFNSLPEEFKEKESSAVTSISKILELKKAGFNLSEIIEMKTNKMI